MRKKQSIVKCSKPFFSDQRHAFTSTHQPNQIPLNFDNQQKPMNTYNMKTSIEPKSKISQTADSAENFDFDPT